MNADGRAYNSSLDAALESGESSRPGSEPQHPAPRNNSGLAIVSLVFGILSVLGGGILLIPPILAVVFGHLAVNACNRDPSLDGKGIAIAGLILGWIVLVAWLAVLLLGGLAFLSIYAS
jgi:hypothetical protein